MQRSDKIEIKKKCRLTRRTSKRKIDRGVNGIVTTTTTTTICRKHRHSLLMVTVTVTKCQVRNTQKKYESYWFTMPPHNNNTTIINLEKKNKIINAFTTMVIGYWRLPRLTEDTLDATRRYNAIRGREQINVAAFMTTTHNEYFQMILDNKSIS